MSNAAIENVRLKIGEQTIDLTVQQARELSNILDDLFGEPRETIRIVHEHDYPHWHIGGGITYQPLQKQVWDADRFPHYGNVASGGTMSFMPSDGMLTLTAKD